MISVTFSSSVSVPDPLAALVWEARYNESAIRSFSADFLTFLLDFVRSPVSRVSSRGKEVALLLRKEEATPKRDPKRIANAIK